MLSPRGTGNGVSRVLDESAGKGGHTDPDLLVLPLGKLLLHRTGGYQAGEGKAKKFDELHLAIL